MGKLVGINGYDSALPSAYQGRAMGGGCGCGGGMGAVYPFIIGRPGNGGVSPENDQKVAIDIPTDKIVADLMLHSRIERIAITAGLAAVLIGGMYFLGKR
jgi:hypothetical protein